MRIISALREGKQFTVKDIIQTWGMDPSEVSSAVGALKEAKVVQIAQGGILALDRWGRHLGHMSFCRLLSRPWPGRIRVI